MNKEGYIEFFCDLCGFNETIEVPYARLYTGEQIQHNQICKSCGLVYVKYRRSAETIAATWTNEIYGEVYTARIPAMLARQTFVADFIDVNLGLKYKKLCDIGSGEGQFIEIVKKDKYGASGFGTEASVPNCEIMNSHGIDCFSGTVEEFSKSKDFGDYKADIVTIMWTLEACTSCRDMLAAAYDVLDDNGHIVIATGSRILVPFKKPMHLYFSSNLADVLPVRFSVNTLQGLLAVSGFEVSHISRYLDSDILCMIAKKTDKLKKIEWNGDDYLKVADFFERWHKDSIYYR